VIELASEDELATEWAKRFRCWMASRGLSTGVPVTAEHFPVLRLPDEVTWKRGARSGAGFTAVLSTLMRAWLPLLVFGREL